MKTPGEMAEKYRARSDVDIGELVTWFEAAEARMDGIRQIIANALDGSASMRDVLFEIEELTL